MIHTIIRWGVFAGIIGVCLFVVVRNYQDRASLVVEYDFFREGARISRLYPEDRVSGVYARSQKSIKPPPEADQPLAEKIHKVEDTDIYFQEVAGSPAYFDIRYWQKFTKATVEVEYDNGANIEWGIGYKAGKDFQWKIEKIQNSKSKIQNEGNTEKATVEFDLKNEFVERGNVHRWIVSALRLEGTGKGIRVYSLKLIFAK